MAEWQRLGSSIDARVLGDGWVQLKCSPRDTLPDSVSLAFATQIWPDAQSVHAASVTLWAQMVAQQAIDQVPGDAPWRLHLFAHDHGNCFVSQGRLALIDAAVWRVIKQKQRRLCRSFEPSTQRPLGPTTYLVSVALLSATTGFISVVAPASRQRWRPTLSRFAGGFVPIVEDVRPPARAYRKLREALAHLNVVPTAAQTWVDLGAAPGSWSYDAIQAGARVYAVDRSPLREDLMQAANLTYVKADAFVYRPQFHVDVMLCDVIAYPERNTALLESWLSEGLCGAFVVTLKFRGADDYVKVDGCKALLARLSQNYVFRQLYHNKNEVTAAGFCKAPRG